MKILNEILVYIFKNYPNPSELSKARAVKIVYLADWKSALDNGKQITDIQWIFNHYGPYVNEIVEQLKIDDRFETTWTYNFYGQPKELITLRDKAELRYKLDDNTKEILDYIIKITYPLYFSDFINLVYSTYPIRTQPRYTILDLVSLSKEYKEKILSTHLTPIPA
jgi:hypothetical protein